jgi:DNA topoisomerase-1
VASRLGNTVAVCKKCYVHPQILEGYLDGTLAAALNRQPRQFSRRWRYLQAQEAAVLALLKSRAARQERQNRNPFSN